jgi:hypothetical protein
MWNSSFQTVAYQDEGRLCQSFGIEDNVSTLGTRMGCMTTGRREPLIQRFSTYSLKVLFHLFALSKRCCRGQGLRFKARGRDGAAHLMQIGIRHGFFNFISMGLAHSIRALAEEGLSGGFHGYSSHL